jgi:hypothetical protein
MRNVLVKNILAIAVAALALPATVTVGADAPTAASVAERVDQLILQAEGSDTLVPVDDSTYLRRVYLDIVGRPPSPGQITAFGLDPSADKRQDVVRQLLAGDEYATNWSRYWRDAMFVRATNTRSEIVRPAFEEWMAENLASNRKWDQIVTDLLTAKGEVGSNGATALMFIHEGQPEEIAAEASRLFTGIQIQCANCHDHPWDRWKREQFHEFVAFFPRVSVRRDRSSDRLVDWLVVSVDRDTTRRPGVSKFLLTRLDRNRDNIISESEAGNSPLQRIFTGQAKSYIDKDGDGQLTVEEIMTAQPPSNNRPGQGSTEHYMADLSDPASQGTRIDPVFFVGDQQVRKGLNDADRRQTAASLTTSPDNPWFARAIVNRMWAELTGTAFYAPIDDLGPDRTATHEAAMNVLCEAFVASDHDLKWLIETIAATNIYQRPLDGDSDGFLHLEPGRLRADQLYDSLCQTLNVDRLPLRPTAGRRSPFGGRDMDRGRQQFAETFGFDPSVPRSDLTGSIPESLFMMNAPLIESMVRSQAPNSTLTEIIRRVSSDEEVVQELYLAAVSREPTNEEIRICSEYIKDSESRRSAYEDILWSLINSSEFMSKR